VIGIVYEEKIEMNFLFQWRNELDKQSYQMDIVYVALALAFDVASFGFISLMAFGCVAVMVAAF
jgi:hypothetical protein